jgi:hypothetical protein
VLAPFAAETDNPYRRSGIMSRLMSVCSAGVLLVCAAGVTSVQAGRRAVTLAVIMTNDPMSNQINVYDVDTHALLQTLSTHGKGGVNGNARGVKQYNGELFAVVNNGSNTVAIYKRDGNGLSFDTVRRNCMVGARAVQKPLFSNDLASSSQWDCWGFVRSARLRS